MKREDGGARNHGNVKKDFEWVSVLSFCMLSSVNLIVFLQPFTPYYFSGTKTAQKREKGEARNPGNVSADIE